MSSSPKIKRTSSKAKSQSSPTSSPPLPPAPLVAQNRGSASPRHRKAELDPAVTPPEPIPVQNRRPASPRNGIAESDPEVKVPRPKRGPREPLPGAENGDDLAGLAIPIPGPKKSSVRRFITRLLVLYLGYTLFFVCPKSTAKDTNAVCEGVSKLQGWLRSYSDPAYETYRTYAEPYVDQYGRPLYEQGQKYYAEVAQPVLKTASNKAKTSYNQYAQPHVVKLTDTIYTDDVKNHLNRAQKTFATYRGQVYGHTEHAKKIYRNGQEQAWQLYDEHVQPVVSKVSPHAKGAWDRASDGTSKAYDTASVFYMKHVNPYAQHSLAVVLDAAANAKETFARHTDEIWGTRFSKQNQSKPGRAASRAAKKAEQAKEKAQKAAEQAAEKAKQAKADADTQAETLKDALLQKAADAQKVVTDEAERLKKLAEDRVQEAGKISDEIKETVVQKAHEAQEAVAHQAESIRHSAQEASAHLFGTSHDAKEAVGQQAKYAAEVAQEEAKKTAQDASQQAQNVLDTAAQQAESVKNKVAESGNAAVKAAGEKAGDIKKAAQGLAKDAQEFAQEQANNLYGSTEQIVMSGKEHLDRQAENVNKAKDYVNEKVNGKVKDAGEQIENAKETVKHKAHDANAASKASLAAMLAGIEETFGKFYEYEDAETKNLWSNLQSSIDEHITAAKNTASNLEKANREVYETFESYVRDWRNQGGNLEDRLSDLHHQSVEAIKDIVHKSSDDQEAAKSKAKVLSNNVEVYLSGLKGFLEDRLAASKETVASELSAFKDTSSKDDENTLTAKIAELNQAAMGRLDQAGQNAHDKVQELMHQVSEMWSQSEDKSQEFVQLTRNLAKKTREDAKAAFQSEPNIRIATEEPGSGHRHHRH
ncbi:hypothetical protein BGX26_000982 [Mortierella sp. AD094]|nr:hypothetical protein BGX26_000982 [Mortierella sp. AD094]